MSTPTLEDCLAELKLLRQKVIVLNEEKEELELLLQTVTEHADIVENDLIAARQIAEDAARAKSAFLANMSHEIRTPLNGVIGMTSLLLDSQLTSEQYDYVTTIRSSGEALLSLINDILDFSKIEAGKLELEHQPLNLRECVEFTLDLIAPVAAQKKLNLAYSMTRHTPDIVVSDVTRLRQVLMNLLSNAVKFTQQGEITVSIVANNLSSYIEDKPYNTKSTVSFDEYEILFSVQDTGIGIPTNRLEHLFQSFNQLDSTTARKYGGTGLGLAISKRLCELMGGQIWVETEEGKGSVFNFTIKAKAIQGSPHLQLYSKVPEFIDKNLLVCSDNLTNQTILERQAKQWGMLTHRINNKEEILQLIQENRYVWDVVILDLNELDEKEINYLRQIKNTCTNKRLYIISLLPLCHFNFTDMPFDAYITKPIKPIKLYEILIQLLRHPTRATQTLTEPSIDKKVETRQLRILLAEDNVVNQKVALLVLKKLGYYAEVVTNGVEALDVLRQHKYDIVFMDIQMPEMDGLTATRHIIADWQPEQRPWIIAMTASAMQGDREACLEAGMNDYISKPIRMEELQLALSRYISEAGF